MPIIFGWGFKTRKVLGERRDLSCPVCGCGTIQYMKVTTWFTLFFIPMIPYSTKYFELCPSCEHGIEVTKDQLLADMNNVSAFPAYSQPIPESAEPFATNESEAN